MKTSLIIAALTIIGGTAMAADPVTHIPFVQKSLKAGYGSSHIYSLQSANISSDIPMEKESGENFYRGRRQYIDEYNASVEYGGMLSDWTYVEFIQEPMKGHLSIWLSSQLESCSDITEPGADKIKLSQVTIGQTVWQVAEVKEIVHAQHPDKADLYRVYERCRLFYRLNEESGTITALTQGADVIMTPHNQEAIPLMIKDLDKDYWKAYSRDFYKILTSFKEDLK